MAGISFGDKIDSVWIVAGWAFRQALEDLTPHAGGDTVFLDALTGAGHIGFLDVQSLQDPVRVEMTRAVEAMCRGILDGSCPSIYRSYEEESAVGVWLRHVTPE